MRHLQKFSPSITPRAPMSPTKAYSPEIGIRCGEKHCVANAKCVGNSVCVCEDGFYGIGDIRCSKMCTCGSGGPNLFETFDGQILHFSGKCQFRMSSYTDPRGTCSYSVDLVTKQRAKTHLIVKILQMDVMLLQNKLVRINGQDRSLPAGNSKFIIYKAGFAIRLFVPNCGFLISWDGVTNLLISVPTAYTNGLDGICGNCNQNKKDDPTATDVFSKFTVTNLSKSTCENAFSTTRCNRRSKLMMKMRVCKYQDRAIKRRCNLSFKESKMLTKACIESGCDFMTKRNRKAAIETGCQTLDLVSGICRANGHDVNWRIFPLNDCRRPRCASSSNMETNFGKGISGCPQTCGFAFEGKCTLPLAEGCKCKKGFVWDGDGCVRPTECGCTTPGGDYISIGKSLISEHCAHVYKCEKQNGKATLKEQPGPCVNRNCVVVNGQPKCTTCREGFIKTPNGCMPKISTTPGMQPPVFMPPEGTTPLTTTEAILPPTQPPILSPPIEKCIDSDCPSNAECSDNKCTCKAGFIDILGTCERKCIDSECPPNAECSDNKCACKPGFLDIMGVCEIECEDDNCQSNALCKNNECVCVEGYLDIGGNCEAKCVDSACPSNSACVDNKCKCDSGYVEINGECEVKCVYSDCQANAVCRHNKCTCKVGFIERSGSCEELCHSFNCPRFASCVDNRCTCNRGYLMIGNKCEVKCDASKCARNAECESNKCQCRRGYIGDGDTKCQESCGGKICGKNARCSRYGRRRKCKCVRGFYGDGFTCTDTCGGKKCHMYARCINNECVCAMGTYGSGENCKRLCGWKRVRCGENASCYRGKCKCDGGFEGDGMVCKKLCTCAITSDSWYNLYDGNFVRFAGTCKYTLSQYSNPSSPCQYKTEIKYQKTDSPRKGSTLEYIEITASGKRIHMGRNLEVMVDGLQVYLPYTSAAVTIHYSGIGVIVLFNGCSIRLFWNGRGMVALSVPLDFGDSLTGICGNCNKERDDLRTRGGTDVSSYGETAGSYIGESYLVKDFENNQTCESLGPTITCWNRRGSYSFRKCGMLNKKYKYSPFKRCMRAFPELADRMYKACRQDYCASSLEAESSLCKHLEGFATLCAKRGQLVYWRYRVPTCKRKLKCGKRKFYWWFASACPNTCMDPNAEKKCSLPKTESCRCAHGFVLSGEKCVRAKDCGCTRGPYYFPLKAVYTKPDCSGVDTCRKLPGKKRPQMVKGKKQNCHTEATCDVIHGVPQCTCQIGFTGDGVKKCKPATSCSVSENVRNCSATIELAGECFYKSRHTQACRYTTLSVTDGKTHRAYVKFKGQTKSRSLPRGHTSLGCADFTFSGDRVIIEEKICDCPGH